MLGPAVRAEAIGPPAAARGHDRRCVPALPACFDKREIGEQPVTPGCIFFSKSREARRGGTLPGSCTGRVIEQSPRDEIGRSNLPLRLQALDSRMNRVAHNHPEIDMGALRQVAGELVTTRCSHRGRDPHSGHLWRGESAHRGKSAFPRAVVRIILLDHVTRSSNAALAHAGETALSFALDQ